MTEKAPDIQEMAFEQHHYARSRRNREDLRGTLYFRDDDRHIIRKVPGFPAIKRSYRLGEGITRLFGNECFWAEEKLDGYNARIFKYDGLLFGATRGGFICPFTTEWARIWEKDLNLGAFFYEYPEYTLCGEVCGDNPYNWQRDPDLPEGAHFFIFEITAPDGTFLPPEKRYEILNAYGLPGVGVLGKFSRAETDDLFQTLRELNHRGREGTVLKDTAGRRRMKFVTPSTDIEDLKDTLQIGFDLDAGYFFNRYLRAAIFVREFGLDEDEYARRIGRAFLDGIPRAGEYRESRKKYLIHVLKKSTWETLRDMLRGSVQIRTDDMEPVMIKGREMLRVRFRRIYQKSTHRFRRILKGHLHED